MGFTSDPGKSPCAFCKGSVPGICVLRAGEQGEHRTHQGQWRGTSDPRSRNRVPGNKREMLVHPHPRPAALETCGSGAAAICAFISPLRSDAHTHSHIIPPTHTHMYACAHTNTQALTCRCENEAYSPQVKGNGSGINLCCVNSNYLKGKIGTKHALHSCQGCCGGEAMLVRSGPVKPQPPSPTHPGSAPSRDCGWARTALLPQPSHCCRGSLSRGESIAPGPPAFLSLWPLESSRRGMISPLAHMALQAVSPPI